MLSANAELLVGRSILVSLNKKFLSGRHFCTFDSIEYTYICLYKPVLVSLCLLC
jgi:hypothetical protein